MTSKVELEVNGMTSTTKSGRAWPAMIPRRGMPPL